ncbi:MAG: hypothetical protein Q8M22_10350 [Actinomycetota bacterium]|nr:hypothetical protein [Actinomycetota bacterium]
MLTLLCVDDPTARCHACLPRLLAVGGTGPRSDSRAHPQRNETGVCDDLTCVMTPAKIADEALEALADPFTMKDLVDFLNLNYDLTETRDIVAVLRYLIDDTGAINALETQPGYWGRGRDGCQLSQRPVSRAA